MCIVYVRMCKYVHAYELWMHTHVPTYANPHTYAHTRIQAHASTLHCLPVECRQPNYLADWTQTAYRCQAGSDDGFWLGPIPIGHELALPLHALALHTGCRHTHMHAHTYIHTYTISLDTFWLQLKPNGIDPCLFLKELFYVLHPAQCCHLCCIRAESDCASLTEMLNEIGNTKKLMRLYFKDTHYSTIVHQLIDVSMMVLLLLIFFLFTSDDRRRAVISFTTPLYTWTIYVCSHINKLLVSLGITVINRLLFANDVVICCSASRHYKNVITQTPCISLPLGMR